MKAILFSAMLLAAVCASAQEVTIYRLSNTNAYPGKNVPEYIVTNFEKANPGATVLAWEPMNATWRATFHENNRIVHVYYNELGHHYRSVLPIVQNNVPEEVISAAISKYGGTVYAITASKGMDDKNVYQVRLIENGTARTVWTDAAGNEAGNVFRMNDAKEPVDGQNSSGL